MSSSVKWKLVRIAVTTIPLMAGWLLFSWTLTVPSLLLGFVLSLLIALFTYPIFIDQQEAGRRTLLPRLHYLLPFLALLMFKMYVASFRVLFQLVLGRINPRIVHFRTRLRSDTARLMLASSITLTPGTITLNLDEDHLVVHWLTSSTTHSRLAGERIKGSFERLLRRIWG